MLSSAITYHNKKILVAPLDWGLGHVTRCIPLVKFLQSRGNSITVACDTLQRNFFERELEGVSYTGLPGYNVRYSKDIPLGMMILLQYPRLYSLVQKENRWLEEYLSKYKTDVVISDNRYGLHSKKAETVLITHQLFIRSPFFSGWVNKINHRFIKKFGQCWVPDLEEKEHSLSGVLSHGPHRPGNIKYIGPLSRFSPGKINSEKKYQLLLFLSGPEPQRTLLEEKLLTIFGDCGIEVTLIRGTRNKRSFPENFTVIDMAHSAELESLLLNAENIICRPGYSTLMDLHALGKKAFLIPTPGQTEQEYLAGHWHQSFGFKCVRQNKISKELLHEFIGRKEILPAHT